MRWFGITGSWRSSNEDVERDVRASIRELVSRGDGIVSGGALGVDWMATDEALRVDPSCLSIKIFLPTTLKIYVAHYRERAKEGIITNDQAESLIRQLQNISAIRSSSIIENLDNVIVNKDTYYERNTKVVEYSDELLAFHVNDSKGVQDTIDKALARNIPVKIRRYTITDAN